MITLNTNGQNNLTCHVPITIDSFSHKVRKNIKNKTIDIIQCINYKPGKLLYLKYFYTNY